MRYGYTLARPATFQDPSALVSQGRNEGLHEHFLLPLPPLQSSLSSEAGRQPQEA